MIWTAKFWKATAERATKTAAQSAILVIGADQLDVLSLDWLRLVGFAAGGALLSVLTSIASAGVGEEGPSLANEKVVS